MNQSAKSTAMVPAECGRDADPPGKLCPLNTCCSQYGFCGTTEDFCTNDCQSSCNLHPLPPGNSPQAQSLNKITNRYQSWPDGSSCHQVSPTDLALSELTHQGPSSVEKDYTWTIRMTEKECASCLTWLENGRNCKGTQIILVKGTKVCQTHANSGKGTSGRVCYWKRSVMLVYRKGVERISTTLAIRTVKRRAGRMMRNLRPRRSRRRWTTTTLQAGR